MGMLGRLGKWGTPKGSEAGFTLVELAVVMILAAALLAIAVPSSRARAQEAAARANVRAAIPALESYFAENGTYVGMTLADLRLLYDSGLSATLTLSSLTPSGYCVESAVGGEAYRKNGPSVPIEASACP